MAFYDELTGDIYDSAGNIIDNVSETVAGLYSDAKGGLATAADLAGQGFTAVGEVAEAGQRAANLGFLLVLIPTAAAAYWYFLGASMSCDGSHQDKPLLYPPGAEIRHQFEQDNGLILGGERFHPVGAIQPPDDGSAACCLCGPPTAGWSGASLPYGTTCRYLTTCAQVLLHGLPFGSPVEPKSSTVLQQHRGS